MKNFLREIKRLPRGVKIALAVFLAFLCWVIFSPPSGNDTQRGGRGRNSGPAFVGAQTIKTGDMNIYLNALGTITPRNVVTIRARVDGELTQILFREGDSVKAGDVIAQIDPKPYEAQLAQATGQMARDTALLNDARINLKRYQTLFKQDSIARQQLDTQASLVKQYEGVVQADQGQVDNAKLQLGYTKITSPISGRIGLRQVDPGNIVHAGDTNGIAVVTELQPISAIFSLPEDNIPAVMKRMGSGDAIPTEAWSRDDKTKLATGSLLAVDNQVDTTTGTVKFKAEFANEDNTLFANQFVNIHMLLDTKKDVVIAPLAAIHRGTQGTFVYVAKDDKTVTLQTIGLGITENENVEVTSGLKAGDIVVVDGSDALKDGSKIEIASLDGKTTNEPESSGDSENKKSGKRRHKKEEP